MKQTFLEIVWDTETRKHYSVRRDDPDHPYHELTIGGATELQKKMVQFEEDAWNEIHRRA